MTTTTTNIDEGDKRALLRLPGVPCRKKKKNPLICSVSTYTTYVYNINKYT